LKTPLALKENQQEIFKENVCELDLKNWKLEGFCPQVQECKSALIDKEFFKSEKTKT
jgi:hypothetical protein